MPPSRNLSTYSDVYYVLEKALISSPLRCAIPTSGKATHFRMRINSFLKLLREHTAESSESGLVQTKYDSLEHFICNNDPNVVVVRKRPEIEITSLEGAPSSFDQIPPMESILNAKPKTADKRETSLDEIAAGFARAQGITTGRS